MSRFFYALCFSDELWKDILEDEWAEGSVGKVFARSWRESWHLAHKLPIHPPLLFPNLFSDILYSEWYYCHVSLDALQTPLGGAVPVRHQPSLDQFAQEFGLPNHPAVLRGVVEQWPAFAWTRESLLAKYGELVIKTDHAIDMRLREYFDYCQHAVERNPMYLFDNEILAASGMVKDYNVPEYFSEDFFRVLESHNVHRPSFQWLLVGPARSGLPPLTAGAAWHKDPNATSAWNGLISGRKKWLFYPPEHTPPGVYARYSRVTPQCRSHGG